ncbi:MAG TPA: GFA family protein [Steroidobacteraceae bacterium]|jgi:hypothetical protein|nr:GFA family protein [Steroidobacteraceae bacterium]
MYTGRCLCGAIQFKAAGEPRSVHYCHCSMCRRATASAFAVLAWFSARSIVWSGQTPQRRRSSSIAERAFCARCGSPLFLKYDNSSEIGLMLGCFDRADLLAPAYHYTAESRLPWVELGDGIGASDAKEKLHSPTPA